MASSVSQTEPHSTKGRKLAEESEKEGVVITSHLYLKPAHSSQTLDKDEVLQRIRQRKRVNKVQATLQALLRVVSSKPNKVSIPQKKWLDDAFAAP